MKVNHIELISSSGELFCTLGFRDPKSLNPYIMRGIVGLDATDIVPKFYGLGEDSRVKYYNMTLTARDLVLRIGLNPNFVDSQTFSDLRDDLTRKLVSSRSGEVRVFFKDGPGTEGVRGFVYGFLTKIEAPLLQDPEIQITLKCLNPMIRGLAETIASPTPEGDGSLIVVDDISTAPHAFNWSIEIDEDCPSIAMHTDADYGDWAFTVVPGEIGADEGFLAGDVLIVRGQTGIQANLTKSITLERDAESIPIADKIQAGSLWPIMFPGSNQYVIASSGDFTWNEIEYLPEFWGL